MDEITLRIAKNFCRIKKQNRYSYREISEQTGYSLSFLSNLAGGRRTASIHTLTVISDFFNIDILEFFKEVEDGEE